MEDFIIILIVAAIIVGIVIYLRRERKAGAKCIGCPYAKECGRKNCPSSTSRKKSN